MTRTGASKLVDAGFAAGRLTKARAFHEAARIMQEHAARLGDPAPVAANAILAAVAYADALTASFGGRINQQNHAAAPKLLRDALGAAVPDAQAKRLARLLGRKDEMQYGARLSRSQDAAQILEDLDNFAAWAAGMLAVRLPLAASDPAGKDA